MTSKELSQDSKADKSQQLKKETKDQQRTHSVKEEICCVCEEKFCIVFRVRESENWTVSKRTVEMEPKGRNQNETQRSCLHLDNCTENDSK